MKVTCVIPTYNEAASLATLINNLKEVVDQIIVVDDASVDNTLEILKPLPVDVLRHVVNRGQGAALKTGTMQALKSGADVIVHFDADGQFRIEDIARLVEPIKANKADVVFGSRFLDNTTVMPSFKKRIIMPLARLVNRWLFNIRLTDPQSGFRAFSRRAAMEIDWDQDRMAHCSEILVAAHRSGLALTEVPITVIYKDFGQRFSGGFKILRDLFFAKMNN
jgi:glycosyltransferase involved in cell wall biosynthesis